MSKQFYRKPRSSPPHWFYWDNIIAGIVIVIIMDVVVVKS